MGCWELGWVVGSWDGLLGVKVGSVSLCMYEYECMSMSMSMCVGGIALALALGIRHDRRWS
jgi:hypothetical protein